MTTSSDDCMVVLMTAPDGETAERIGRGAVTNRLAACANILQGVRSIYRWKDEICDEPEALVIFKTRRDVFGLLEQYVKAEHPYEVPELVALRIEAGLDAYMGWIAENTLVKDPAIQS